MGLGILEDKVLSHVPGTEVLTDDNPSAAQSNLKKSKDGIVLVPQPSDDPEDPLNWPIWRRDLITLLLSLAAVFSVTLTPIMAANSIGFLEFFKGISITQVAMLTGWNILGIGIGGYVFVASARIWGKRHLYLLGMLIVVASAAWGGCSGHNYKSLVAARFFQGVGLAPFEALLNASVGELYFVHESGLRMALSNTSLFGAPFLAPVIVGYMTERLGWPWTFWLVAILVGALFPAVFLLCPETAFVRRQTQISTTTPSENDSPATDDDKHSMSTEKIESRLGSTTESWISGTQEPNRQYVKTQLITRRSLRIFTGRKTDDSFFCVLVRPFPLYFHPIVLWACLIQGSVIGWTTLLGAMLAVLMLQLGFNEVNTGNMFAGAFIGAMLGFVTCAVFCDFVAKWMTRLNKGIYEPEFRLVGIIPTVIFAAGGLYGFGMTAKVSYGWLLPDVFFAWLCGGLVFGTVSPALYVIDAIRDLSVEAFTCMLLFKCVLSWALCYKGFEWLFATSTERLFTIIGSVEVALCALTIPLYVFGKRGRSFFSRHDYLKKLGLRKRE